MEAILIVRKEREEISEAISYIKSYRKLDENLHNTAPKGSVGFYATEKCLHYWDMAIEALQKEACKDTVNVAQVKEECLSVIFPECRYCTHRTLRCMPDDHACKKCVRYDPMALPSGYQQKEEEK